MIPGIRKVHAPAASGGLVGDGIVEVLRADHAQLTALFDRFIAVTKGEKPAAVRDRLARCICDALSTQRLAEQEVVYPEIRKENDKLVFAFQLADECISLRIAHIRDPAAPQSERDFAMLRLIGMVRRYMLEREQVLFPFLRSRLSATRMQWLCADLAQRKLAHAAGNAAEMPSAADVAGDSAPMFADPVISLLAWRMRDAREEARN
jgi:hypothetical protein